MDRLAWKQVEYEGVWKSGKLVLRRRVDEYCVDAEDSPCPEEIRSGAILPDPFLEGAFLIEANTAQGRRRFTHAIEMQSGDPQSDNLTRAYGWRIWHSADKPVFVPRALWAQTWTGTSHVVPLTVASTANSIGYFPQEMGRQSTRTFVDVTEDEADPAAILEGLEATSSSKEYARLVVEAEPLSFGANQISRLRASLKGFIQRNRDSNVPEILVAINSAIRKFVGILPADQLGEVGFILESGHRASVSPEIELEVAKMAVRKLSANLLQQADLFPELGSQFMDLARTYLNPRLLPRQHHGAIALNSVLALALLRSRHLAEVCATLRDLRVPWFKQLVARRSEEASRDFGARSIELFRAHHECLEMLTRSCRDD